VAQKGIQVLIAIIPSDSPGSSIRTVFDPDLPPGLLGHEIGMASVKLIKKMRKKETPA
jgi:hypothetical protein